MGGNRMALSDRERANLQPWTLDAPNTLLPTEIETSPVDSPRYAVAPVVMPRGLDPQPVMSLYPCCGTCSLCEQQGLGVPSTR